MGTRGVLFISLMAVAATGCATRAPWPAEGVFSGYYVWGFERSDFRPAGTAERWWISGVVDSLRGQPSTPNPAYIAVRGTLSAKGRFGHLGGYVRELLVEEIIEVRAVGGDEHVPF